MLDPDNNIAWMGIAKDILEVSDQKIKGHQAISERVFDACSHHQLVMWISLKNCNPVLFELSYWNWYGNYHVNFSNDDDIAIDRF